MSYYDIYNNSTRQVELTDYNIELFLSKIPNKTVKKGITALYNEEYKFNSLNRAIEVLNGAKNEHDLQIVEAALQTTINEIKDFSIRNPKYWTNQKTSLYLYTLQYLVLHLSSVELPNTENKYKPQLVAKIHELNAKCNNIGVDFNIMREQCVTTEYQQPDNEDLRNFKFIDVTRIDTFNKRLNKYAVTRNIDDLYYINDNTKKTPSINSTQVTATIQKLIVHFENKFGIKKLDLDSYIEHNTEIVNEINTLFKTADPELIRYITEALVYNLEIREQSQNNDRII